MKLFDLYRQSDHYYYYYYFFQHFPIGTHEGNTIINLWCPTDSWCGYPPEMMNGALTDLCTVCSTTVSAVFYELWGYTSPISHPVKFYFGVMGRSWKRQLYIFTKTRKLHRRHGIYSFFTLAMMFSHRAHSRCCRIWFMDLHENSNIKCLLTQHKHSRMPLKVSFHFPRRRREVIWNDYRKQKKKKEEEGEKNSQKDEETDVDTW